MLNALGQVLPFVLGLIATPVPILAVVYVLMAPGGRFKALVFVVGWALAVLAVAAAVGLLAGGGGAGTAGQTPAGVAWVQLGLGVVLLLMALEKLRSHLKRPAGAAPGPPSWMSALDAMGPARLMGLAGVMAVATPKNLAMVLGGATVIASFGLGAVATVSASLVFAALGTIGVLTPLCAAALTGPRGAQSLDRARDWLLANHETVTMTVLFVFGGVFVATGSGNLLG